LEEINKLANEARKSISDFCINECHSFCCREGFIKLKEKEMEIYCENKKELLINEKALRETWGGKYILNLKNSLGGCPQLRDFKCKIHIHPERSNTCKDFPIFIVGKQIKISNRCPAKKEGKFFKFEKEAIALGYEIVDEFF
jgi:Fe-S-cluster containining protein